NFNQPYLAQNPAEFWHRWHISLSTWLRDYLYIPLGGNRKGTARTYVNLILTMLLGGLWHGAAWNFIIWGLYHGTLLAVHRLFTGGKVRTEEEMARTPIANWLCRIVMFHFVCLGWLFFRANSFAQIVTFLKRMATDLVLDRQAAAFLFPLLLLVGFLWVLEL